MDGKLKRLIILSNLSLRTISLTRVFLDKLPPRLVQRSAHGSHRTAGADAGSQSQDSDPDISQSQAWIPPGSQWEARVRMGEILKMITGLAEIIVQRETKLRGAEMKVIRAWGAVTQCQDKSVIDHVINE